MLIIFNIHKYLTKDLIIFLYIFTLKFINHLGALLLPIISKIHLLIQRTQLL